MSTLRQRVDQYLRDKAPGAEAGAFSADLPSAADAEVSAYMLQRAEAELRAAQERLEKLRRALAGGITDESVETP